MSGLYFLWPPYWPAVLLLPLLFAALVWRRRRAERQLRSDLGPRWAAVAGAPVWRHGRVAADGFLLLAIAVALLQPVAPGDEGDSGADVVLCVDVSWSMAARDEVPSRLGAVQRAIAGLAGLGAASRVGLVAFAGEALLVAPLTGDTAALAALADDLVPGAHGAPGTDPGAAIDRASALLQRAGREGAIVVLGDGEDFAGTGAAAAARARAAGHAVFAVGCGSVAGSKIVVGDEGGETFLRDGSGADVVSHLEVDNLQALAAAGGGILGHVAPAALRELHDAVLLPAARAAALRAGRLRPVHLGQWPLLAAVVVWMLRQCLLERRR